VWSAILICRCYAEFGRCVIRSLRTAPPLAHMRRKASSRPRSWCQDGIDQRVNGAELLFNHCGHQIIDGQVLQDGAIGEQLDDCIGLCGAEVMLYGGLELLAQQRQTLGAA